MRRSDIAGWLCKGFAPRATMRTLRTPASAAHAEPRAAAEAATRFGGHVAKCLGAGLVSTSVIRRRTRATVYARFTEGFGSPLPLEAKGAARGAVVRMTSHASARRLCFRPVAVRLLTCRRTLSSETAFPARARAIIVQNFAERSSKRSSMSMSSIPWIAATGLPLRVTMTTSVAQGRGCVRSCSGLRIRSWSSRAHSFR
jgi:hypothetical protein